MLQMLLTQSLNCGCDSSAAESSSVWFSGSCLSFQEVGRYFSGAWQPIDILCHSSYLILIGLRGVIIFKLKEVINNI